jgi:hypothetical protein
MIGATAESLDKAGIDDRPRTLLADAGYASEESFAAFDEDDPDSYVAVRNMNKSPTRRTGRRGPLKKDATLVAKMDRKVSNKRGRALQAAPGDHRAGLRPDRGRPRDPLVQPAGGPGGRMKAR